MMIVDAFSSSEALGMGQSVSTAGGTSTTAKFTLGEHTKVITDDGRLVEPGSGETGRVAVGGFQPVGYYKDEAKTAATFITFEGKRYSVPGDYATVEADGSLTLLGRGSVCINTGGEKVFPEEVEEVIKRFPGVCDVVVVGVPNERFGEAITAVVSSLGPALDTEAIKRFVKEHLAGYKAPKHVVIVDEVYRSPSGKADFKKTKEVAIAALGAGA
jgi:fatty-acyl-CoA synthase